MVADMPMYAYKPYFKNCTVVLRALQKMHRSREELRVETSM